LRDCGCPAPQFPQWSMVDHVTATCRSPFSNSIPNVIVSSADIIS
jgi:hypothetical protein